MDAIKKKIDENAIGAITLDTSVFDGNHLLLETGLLKRLDQFSIGPIKLILSDVIVREVSRHLVLKTKEAQQKINKSLKEARDLWRIDKPSQEAVKKVIFGGNSPESISTQRIDEFVKRTGAVVIKAEGVVSVGHLLDRYFNCNAPFADKETKKYEFPDAIALLTLEAWAEKNETNIIVVTADGDWKRYCEESKRLIVVDKLAVALELFHLKTRAHAVCSWLSKKFVLGELSSIVEAVESAVKDQIWKIDFLPDADSFYYFDTEITEVTAETVEIQEIKEPELTFHPIEVADDFIVVEANVSATIEVNCDFSFSVKDWIDKDYVPMGSASVSKQVDTDINVLITLKGDIKANPPVLAVEDVEILESRKDIHLGYVEPDWDDGEDPRYE